ncbi:hypothetical protein E2C01_014228 [Portunus trituberculatus]|uniref:Uncharacterized protein n=1 Tax=Portunus trituberculatus TaxID=210409 RepID=A0A5B7DIM3_PORTR|nr:hypothetical protein [Portunus trituberculatus]
MARQARREATRQHRTSPLRADVPKLEAATQSNPQKKGAKKLPEHSARTPQQDRRTSSLHASQTHTDSGWLEDVPPLSERWKKFVVRATFKFHTLSFTAYRDTGL